MGSGWSIYRRGWEIGGVCAKWCDWVNGKRQAYKKWLFKVVSRVWKSCESVVKEGVEKECGVQSHDSKCEWGHIFHQQCVWQLLIMVIVELVLVQGLAWTHPVHTLYIANLFTHSILPPCSHALYIATLFTHFILPPCSHSILPPCSHTLYCHHVRTLYIATLFTLYMYCHYVHTLYTVNWEVCHAH